LELILAKIHIFKIAVLISIWLGALCARFVKERGPCIRLVGAIAGGARATLITSFNRVLSHNLISVVN